MRPFRYLLDPLFLLGCTTYAVNRWGLKPHLHATFLHLYLNDTLLIPCALPPVLLAQRCWKLRFHDLSPEPGEILFQVVVWSVLFEWVGPHIMRHATGDPWDVAAYVGGGLIAGLWWQRHRWLPRLATA